MEKIHCQRCLMVPEDYIAFACSHTYCLICLSYSYLQCVNDAKFDPENVQLKCDNCQSQNQLDYDSQQALENALKDILLYNEQEDTSDIFSNKQSEKFQPILPPSVVGKNISQDLRLSSEFNFPFEQNQNQSPFNNQQYIQNIQEDLQFLDLPQSQFSIIQSDNSKKSSNKKIKKKTPPISFRPIVKTNSSEIKKESQKNNQLIEYCNQHNQEIQFFCFGCQNNFICQKCKFSHKNHKIETIEIALSQILVMPDFWNLLNKSKLSIENHNKKLEKQKLIKKQRYQQQQEEIDDRIMKIVEFLQIKQEKLKNDIDTFKHEDQIFYENQIKDNKELIKKINTFIQLCHQPNKLKSLRHFSSNFENFNDKSLMLKEIIDNNTGLRYSEETFDQIDQLLEQIIVQQIKKQASKQKIAQFFMNQKKQEIFQHKKSQSDRVLPLFSQKLDPKFQTDQKYNIKHLESNITPNIPNISKQIWKPPLEFKFKKYEQVF